MNKINKKITDVQKSMVKKIDDYFQLTKIKGMIIEEYIHIDESKKI